MSGTMLTAVHHTVAEENVGVDLHSEHNNQGDQLGLTMYPFAKIISDFSHPPH